MLPSSEDDERSELIGNPIYLNW